MNPYGKTSVLQSLSNELAGINSRLASLVKKASTKDIYLQIYQKFQRFYRKVLHELRLFHKTEGYVLQGCNFIKKLVHHRLFSQNIVFKTASFQYIFQKVSVMSHLNTAGL